MCLLDNTDDVHVGVDGRRAEVEPQPVRQGPEPVGARQLQKGVRAGSRVAGPAAEPSPRLIPAGRHARRALGPLLQLPADGVVQHLARILRSDLLHNGNSELLLS